MKYLKLDNVSSRYGAPMGRRDTVIDSEEPIKFRLYRMPMVDGDYDNGGAYWGAGNHRIGWMYHAYGDGPENGGELFIRAKSRDEAKQKVLETFPNAKFFR